MGLTKSTPTNMARQFHVSVTHVAMQERDVHARRMNTSVPIYVTVGMLAQTMVIH